MNLIDELGGYEKAKDKYDSRPFDLAWSDIGNALLEYRRANNIFEDGDKVIDGLLGNQVITYRDSYKFLGNGYVSHYVRHATDLEIAAGHRINKTELEELDIVDVSPNCKNIGEA